MYNSSWYDSLNKPVLMPPKRIFAPVWNVLYMLIGLSFFLFLFSENTHEKLIPLAFFILQMLFNLSWSPVFFVLRKINLAFLIVVLMWITLLVNIIMFWDFSKLASVLLLPYFFWTTFALYLNFEIIKLN